MNGFRKLCQLISVNAQGDFAAGQNHPQATNQSQCALIGSLLLVAGGYLMVKTETFMCPDYIFPSPEPFLVVVPCWWPSLAQVGAQVTIIRKHIFM